MLDVVVLLLSQSLLFMSTASPLSFQCQDGLELRGMRFQNNDANDFDHHILCLHGWMDNVNSFHFLAPQLVHGLVGQAEVVTMDLPGHGKSSHKSLDGPSMLLMDYVYYVHEILQHLGWKPKDVTLIGHSMGGAVNLMYAAAFPSRELILLDSLGPYVKEGAATKHLRTHIRARLRGKGAQSVYDTIEQAIETRMLTATTFPGNQRISKEAATQLVKGASRILDNGRLEFLHDQRLKMPSILYLTQEQVDEMYKEVATAPTRTLLLLAEEGMPFPPPMVDHVRDKLKPDTFKTLPGSHHFHIDPDEAAGVSSSIIDFLQEKYPRHFE